jgi:hypothetical protein
MKGKTKDAALYRSFCFTAIQGIETTIRFLPDHEKTRPRDIPYSLAYLTDLRDQIHRYADFLADRGKKEFSDMALDP